ncbi:hypothetical protein D7Y16_05495 [Stenotrophomonas maltophilia]|nr:hypothetical protein [Stenotrophomonas maltophilia]MBA0247324.1 hypothetical protein [Stenotrophomonas maltophilia]MBA0306291.1 hypothetical protein [Stenotrophomonas maltophilia]MBA0438903.1 hypothetical protein [Stenotrophomonas maltophilia]MBA0515738.1 hypothetical protein [Stenotrophomonas maltophilia]
MNDIDQTALEIARAFIPVDVVGQQRANLQMAIIEAIKKHANPKTLADVQPGGRVRLGDQAERARAILANAYEQDGNDAAARSVREDDLMYESKIAVKAIIAALSAQPSPGGQDALIDALADDVESCVSDACGYLASNSGWDDYGIYRDNAEERYRVLPDRIRALAARQPVELIAQKIGDYRVTVDEDAITVSRGRDIVFAYSADDPEPIMDRQPVGEPVTVPGAPTSCRHCDSTDLEWFAHVRAVNDVPHGRLTTHDVGCVFVLGCNECSETLHTVKADSIAALLAAPPAQAVDLGAVREALQAAEGLATVCASVDGYSREEVAASGRAMKQQFADALAKIDSKAVGK